VRKGSTTRPIDWQPIAPTPTESRAKIGKWRRAARAWEKITRERRIEEKPGRRRGVLGYTALQVLEVLGDALNHATGELYLSHATIAERSRINVSTVTPALDDLETAGFIRRIRRADQTDDDAVAAGETFEMWQISNAYILLSPINWKGPALCVDDLDKPPIDPAAWGKAIAPNYDDVRGRLLFEHGRVGDMLEEILELEAADAPPPIEDAPPPIDRRLTPEETAAAIAASLLRMKRQRADDATPTPPIVDTSLPWFRRPGRRRYQLE
jgi:hypothetical protein